MIPIVINNRNRLTTTKNLVRDLTNLHLNEITIIDNDSTYPPLLEWYETNPCTILYENNLGPYAIYHLPVFRKFTQVIYTDSDIELNPQTPTGFIETLQGISRRYNIPKVGLGLRIDDLPDNPQTQSYKNWEASQWVNQIEPDIYKGHIDTTFALLNPSVPFSYEGIRVCYPNMIARHSPWYLDFSNLSVEDQYYIENANEYSTLKRFYNSDIKPTK